MSTNYQETLRQVSIGQDGREINVPLLIEKGTERGAYKIFTRRENLTGPFGIDVSAEAILQETIQRGFIFSFDKIKEKLEKVVGDDTSHKGLDISVLGQNCGYLYVNMTPASANIELSS